MIILNENSKIIAVIITFLLAFLIILFGRIVFNKEIVEIGEQFDSRKEFQNSVDVVKISNKLTIYRSKKNKNIFYVKYITTNKIQEYLQKEKVDKIFVKRRKCMNISLTKKGNEND